MSTQSITEQFGVRDKTNRAKVVNFLYKKKGSPVKLADLSRSVYGRTGGKVEDNARKLRMVLVGLDRVIAKQKLPFEIRRENGTIGLFDKGKK